jgi:hypothetical protein
VTTNAKTGRVRRHYDRNAKNHDRLIAEAERVFFGGGREWVCSRGRGEGSLLLTSRPADKLTS